MWTCVYFSLLTFSIVAFYEMPGWAKSFPSTRIHTLYNNSKKDICDSTCGIYIHNLHSGTSCVGIKMLSEQTSICCFYVFVSILPRLHISLSVLQVVVSGADWCRCAITLQYYLQDLWHWLSSSSGVNGFTSKRRCLSNANNWLQKQNNK